MNHLVEQRIGRQLYEGRTHLRNDPLKRDPCGAKKMAEMEADMPSDLSALEGHPHWSREQPRPPRISRGMHDQGHQETRQ